MAIAVICLVSTGLGSSESQAHSLPARPYLVRDLNTTPLSSGPTGFTAVGGRDLFDAVNALGRDNLWVTDGTSAGTHILSLHGGAGDLLEMVRAGNKVYFGGAGSGQTGILWETDGTQGGTRIVPTKSTWPIDGASIAAVGSNLYYLTSNQHVNQLWRTDGTASGTHLIRRVVYAPRSGYHFNETWLFAAGDQLYFVNYTAAAGRELWVTNGTAAGTHLVKDIHPGSAGSNAEPLGAVGNTFYFSANNGVNGTELWKSDGTAAGTVMVDNIAPDIGGHIQSSNPSQMMIAGNEAFFLACSRVASNQKCGRGGGSPNEIWKTDGTPSGTTEVKQISVQENLEYLGQDSSGRPIILFLAWDHAHGERLWRTDGTNSGTQIVGAGNVSGSYITPISTAGHPRAVFVGWTNSKQSQLWVTNGTAAGTRPLVALAPEYLSQATLQGKSGVIFGGYDSKNGNQPWFSDGTPSGTRLIKRLDIGDQGSNIDGIVAAGSRAFLQMNDVPECGFPRPNQPPCPTASHLYTSNGTSSGTSFLRTFTWAFSLTAVGTDTIFLTTAWKKPLQLWRSDGTAKGTVKVADLAAYRQDQPARIFTAGSRAFIIVGPDSLWVTDGTAAGTRLVSNIPYLATYGWISGVDSHSYLYFAAAKAKGSSTYALWRSDGTAKGTRVIWSGSRHDPGSTAPTAIIATNTGVAFETNAGANGRWNLWSTDGLTGITRHLAIFTNHWGPPQLMSLGSRIYFDTQASSGPQLWVSNGTASGTKPFLNFGKGRKTASIAEFASLGTTLYFTGNDGVHGVELWRSNGTASGTRMVRDIWPGKSSSQPNELTSFGGRLYFSAADPVHGRELWVTTGSAATTKPVADIYPGAGSSDPSQFTVAGDLLYFTATDPTHGEELWALR